MLVSSDSVFTEEELDHNEKPGHNRDMSSHVDNAPTDGAEEQHTRSTAGKECQCMPSPGGRNIVVCIDGTANQFGKHNTNVVELYSRLVKSDEQLTYYNSGIGTYVKDSESWLSYEAWKQSIRHGIDQAFATNFKAKVHSAYEWLSENYRPGDRIFLFGFSRGAYQVRVIAGMIEKSIQVGLLHKGNKEQIAFAYDLYTQTIGTKQDREESENMCARFKLTLSRRNVRVHFVGAWDTVSAIGVFRGPNLPETTTGMRYVCTFRHALALDELRVKFLPEYANGGEGPLYAEDGSKGTTAPLGDVKEVWFAGSHSDIGGGNVTNLELDHFGPSLRWMSYEAIKKGLKMEPHRHPFKSLIPMSSMNMFYRVVEYFPISRLSYKGRDDIIRWPPSRQSPRRILLGQLIHESVFATGSEDKEYEPAAKFWDNGLGWDKVSLEKQKMVEDDPYSRADEALRALEKSHGEQEAVDDHHFHALVAVSASGWCFIFIISNQRRLLNISHTSEISRRSITEFPNACTILTTALQEEFYRSYKPEDKDFRAATLAGALDSFEIIPRNPGYIHDSALWFFLDNLYPKKSRTWWKLYHSFGPISPFSSIFIGINKYAGGFPLLTGCIGDALSLSAFLADSFGMSDSGQSVLLDERATRATIIENISSLAHNEQIKFNDPIIIFFAGHAMLDNSNTGCIVPYGYPDGGVISASVINDLLAHVATVKGNNITLILDCSHAGGFKGDSYASANFSSHVLLASCRQFEESRESSGHGAFTSDLMRVLREVKLASGTYTCTYRDIIQRLKLPGQNPLCLGKHNDRFIFSTKKPTALRDVTPTESDMDRQNERVFKALQNIREQRGQGHKLCISIAMDDSPLSHDVVEQLVGQDSDTLRFVGRDNPHQVLVLVRNGNTVFEIRDRDELTRLLTVATSDVRVIGRILEHASHFLWYLWRSPSLKNEKGVRDITLEAWRLGSIDGHYTSASLPDGGNLNLDGIIKIAVANTDKSSLKLGFKLTNSSEHELFVWVFAFNVLDLGIDTIYKPAFVDVRTQCFGQACLPARGHLKFSNVSSGKQLTVLPPGIKKSVSYLKIFISNFFVDLSFIEQASPLHIDGQLHDFFKFPSDSSDLHDAFTNSTSETLRLRGGARKPMRPMRPFWDIIVVPIVKQE
ncbi:hypothetical protein CVT25_004461 [Psilocybe cyanescens]|uniref:Uncharacterized protein n=1 Tax=Psilocybe cyanescens TaxID=93625 RepID=A0A409X2G3_PSICY|nr:hypothetical protein CVT25_004461 [Psilocybe cyanescens]